MTDRDLRSGLTDIADDVRPSDLYNRALTRSGQIARRRGAAMIVGAAVAVVIVAGSVWQLTPRNTSQPLPPASPSTVESPPPSTTAEPTTPPPTTTPPPAPPLGADTRLGNARLTVPAWPSGLHGEVCPTGPIPFRGGFYRKGTMALRMGYTVRGEAGGPAYATVLYCASDKYELSVSQVVAYRASGSFALIGKVVDTSVPAAGSGTRVRLGTIGSNPRGGFDVQVELQTVAGSAPPQYALVSQVRTFAWDGEHFGQIFGPSVFLADPAKARLVLTPTELRFLPPDAKGCRTGTTTVTVTNEGPNEAGDVTVAIITPTVEVSDECPAPASQGYGSSLATLGTIPPGQSRKVELTVVTKPTDEPPAVVDQPYDFMEIHVGQTRYPETMRLVLRFA
jgi:hypothetical protein